MASQIALASNATIKRPIEHVWEFVSNPRNEPRWHTDILAIRTATDPSSEPDISWSRGSRWVVTVQFMGRRDYEIEITDVQPNQRIEISTMTGPMRPTASYKFESVDGGTRFTRSVVMPLSGPMRLAAPLMRRSMQKRNDGFVANLKHLLEK